MAFLEMTLYSSTLGDSTPLLPLYGVDFKISMFDVYCPESISMPYSVAINNLSYGPQNYPNTVECPGFRV